MIIGGGVAVGMGAIQQKKDYDSRKTLALEFLVDRPSVANSSDEETSSDDEDYTISIGTPENDRIALEEQKKRLTTQHTQHFEIVGTPTKEEMRRQLREQLSYVANASTTGNTNTKKVSSSQVTTIGQLTSEK